MKNRYYGELKISMPYKNINEIFKIKTKSNKGKKYFIIKVAETLDNFTNAIKENKELRTFVLKGHNEGKAGTLIYYEGDFKELITKLLFISLSENDAITEVI